MTAKGEPALGVMLPDAREIHLVDDLRGEELVTTFLHEFNHAVLHEVGLSTTELSPTLEEIIVENLARRYVSVFNLTFKRLKKS